MANKKKSIYQSKQLANCKSGNKIGSDNQLEHGQGHTNKTRCLWFELDKLIVKVNR